MLPGRGRAVANGFDQLRPALAEWGRIGSPGTVQKNVFPSTDLAQAALTKRQNDKIRRGYRPTPPAGKARAQERKVWDV